MDNYWGDKNSLKIRLGFVSNSSSCSFCAYSAPFTVTEIEEQFLLNENEESDIDLFFERLAENNLEYFEPPSDIIYIGNSVYGFDDDKTMKENKQNTEFKLKNLMKPEFAKDVILYWHEEGWYNG
jgi:hypothetical protein